MYIRNSQSLGASQAIYKTRDLTIGEFWCSFYTNQKESKDTRMHHKALKRYSRRM